MAAAAGRHAQRNEPVDEAALISALDSIYVEAAAVVAQPRLLGTVEQWVSKSAAADDERAMTVAMVLAMDLEMFERSLGGAIALDRLARRRRIEGDESAALTAAKQACFTPIRIRSVEEERMRLTAENLFTGATIDVFDGGVLRAAAGATVAARLVPLPSGAFKTFGPVTPLDAAGLGVALDFLRPGKTPNHQRCAAAVYKHVVRHGNPVILGFNDFPDDEAEEAEEDLALTRLDAIALARCAMDGAEPPLEVVAEVRAQAAPMVIVETCFKCHTVSTRPATRPLAESYRWIVELQMETLQRRALAGSAADPHPFDTIEAMMDREIARGDFPRAVKALFAELRKGFERAQRKQTDDALTRVIERIRALRAKTLDQGCTEAEAVAAATKVAELLDRYGLSLSEIDIRKQTCEGVGIESTRKRRTPLDESLDAIAAFCDCRAWQEVTAAGTLRSIFFGLPADVEAAHYLYERIETAFETETRAFQAGPLYAETQSKGRRSATTSFQVGLGNGICTKLRGLLAERDGVRSASGRDLVVLKRSTIDDEMGKLGLRFISKTSKGRLVDAKAFKEGQVAGHKFEARDSLA